MPENKIGHYQTINPKEVVGCWEEVRPRTSIEEEEAAEYDDIDANDDEIEAEYDDIEARGRASSQLPPNDYMIKY